MIFEKKIMDITHPLVLTVERTFTTANMAPTWSRLENGWSGTNPVMVEEFLTKVFKDVNGIMSFFGPSIDTTLERVKFSCKPDFLELVVHIAERLVNGNATHHYGSHYPKITDYERIFLNKLVALKPSADSKGSKNPDFAGFKSSFGSTTPATGGAKTPTATPAPAAAAKAATPATAKHNCNCGLCAAVKTKGWKSKTHDCKLRCAVDNASSKKNFNGLTSMRTWAAANNWAGHANEAAFATAVHAAYTDPAERALLKQHLFAGAAIGGF